MIYLVKKLWWDSLENRDAYGYNPVGITFFPWRKKWKQIVDPPRCEFVRSVADAHDFYRPSETT